MLDGETLMGAVVVMVDETDRHDLARTEQTVSQAMHVLAPTALEALFPHQIGPNTTG